ncbi:MAG: phytanoyl-CoA dioxygenase family protein [Chloroflexota bacterium]|nr:phytanoyl-CoA dioxygenase family protein [Chloroflexota bacterium]
MPTATLVEQFQDQGFVVVADVLDPVEDLQPLINDYAAALDNLASRWWDEGALTNKYADLPFGKRLIAVIQEAGLPYSQHFDISLPLGGITPTTPIHLSAAVFDLLRNPRLLDAVEAIIGSEIYSNPIQHVRIKPPEQLLGAGQREGLTTKTGWHQDQGVALPEADASDILTVWVAITDATEENGCLCVVPRSHRADLITHCRNKEIPDSMVGTDPVPVPMRQGSALLMHRRTQHSSLPNTSDDIRWSFDLRYQPLGQPTGRPMFPGFVARSQRDPGTILSDYQVWREMWLQARTRLSRGAMPTFSRWTGHEPVCA